MKVYFAPMEGITSYIFRNAHHKYFGGVDKYFTPFIAPNQAHCFTSREMRDILPEHNEGLCIVPQILTSKAEHLIRTARELKEMGYEEININLGCPSGTVVAKKRGAGFLSVPDLLDEYLDEIFQTLDMKVSIKTRLGIEDPEEFQELLEIYNQYPMEELIVHPRVQKDFYKGLPRMESFALAMKESKNKLCYNGNLFNQKQYEQWKEAYPAIDAVMIGRGAIANPQLPMYMLEGKRLKKDEFLAFHEEICHGYEEWMNGDRNVLFKMKELWFYFGTIFPDGKKYLKKIKKSQKVKDYMAAVEELVKNCELDERIGF